MGIQENVVSTVYSNVMVRGVRLSQESRHTKCVGKSGRWGALETRRQQQRKEGGHLRFSEERAVEPAHFGNGKTAGAVCVGGECLCVCVCVSLSVADESKRREVHSLADWARAVAR